MQDCARNLETTITDAKVESNSVWFFVKHAGDYWTPAARVDPNLIAAYMAQHGHIISGTSDGYLVAQDSEKGAIVVNSLLKVGVSHRRPTDQLTKQRAAMPNDLLIVNERIESLLHHARQTMVYPENTNGIKTFGFIGNQHIDFLGIDNHAFVVKLIKPYYPECKEVSDKISRDRHNKLLTEWLSATRNGDELGTFFVLMLGSLGRFHPAEPEGPVRVIDQVRPFVDKMVISFPAIF
jgi:hypothetical protein